MPQVSADSIVCKALRKDELDLLLLGKPEYQYFSVWFSASGNTDIVGLLSALYRLVEKYPREELRDHLYRALKKIVGIYEGLNPVASCILFESSARSPVTRSGNPKPQNHLGLPLEEIADELRQNIRVFSFRLEKDKTDGCDQFPNGRLGDLRRLSKNTETIGGPSFCD